MARLPQRGICGRFSDKVTGSVTGVRVKFFLYGIVLPSICLLLLYNYWDFIVCWLKTCLISTAVEVNLEKVNLKVKKFSNLTEVQFEEIYMLPPMDLECSGKSGPSPYGRFPDKYDWRNLNMVGSVLDQKRCIGCWAFSIVGLMETMNAKKSQLDLKKKIQSLSIQELIDCSQHNKGCRGGNAKTALDYMIMTDMRIATEEEYPLKLIDQKCSIDIHGKGVGVRNYTNLCFPSSTTIMSIVANHGPVLALVNAAPWIFYTGGIITEGCDKRKEFLKHIVQIVGYDNSDPLPYYIARNSWGKDFGVDGYVHIAMGKNVCGIETSVFYLDVN